MKKANKNDNKPGALVRVLEQPPALVPAIVLDDMVPFPGPVVPVLLGSQLRREAILHAKSGSGFILLVNRRRDENSQDLPRQVTMVEDALAQDSREGAVTELRHLEATTAHLDLNEGGDDEQQRERPPLDLQSLNSVGILARLMKVVRLPDERLSALVHLMRRASPIEVTQIEPFPMLQVMYPAEVVKDDDEFQALYRQVRVNLQAFFTAHPAVSDDLKVAALSIDVPGHVADFVAQHLSRDYAERLAFLTELDLGGRMRRALEVTIRELDLLTVGNRISQEIRDKVEKHQRDFLLREQLRAIRSELGEEKDPAQLAIAELQKKLDKAGLSKDARTRADEELKRLSLLPSESPEHNVVRSYLEWIASLPWSTMSIDHHDIVRARKILDEDHYGLEEIKQRIIEFLAVHQLNPKKSGTLMCFAGPPGVGKTSLGQSIARALGREFYRFSVGGMRDEAEIKGHRRTYIGAMPGRILQGLRQVKTANPVFMLDELDKMGNDWRGDPSSALLEVLDPAQNHAFMDHYLDLPFDLSRVMFIATVNIQTEIPGPLRDRLEIIDLPGYIPEEKLEIAQRYLVPRQRKEHGLTKSQFQMSRAAVKRIIGEYTHEAGVRELERVVGKVCRKRAIAVVTKKKDGARVGPDDLTSLLGAPKMFEDRLAGRHAPGVVLGLAWTPAGGDVLFIEAVAMPGKGRRKVTGQLGDVMNESTEIAASYVESRAQAFEIDPQVFKTRDLHLHFPAGAVKKDGPSAGVTVTTAIISLLKNVPVRPRLAMTGEMTLRGEVLPVGGIREKVVAARRAGVRHIIVPERNRADVEEIPEGLRKQIQFYFASDYKQVLEVAFSSAGQLLPTAKDAKDTKETKAASRTTQAKSTRVRKTPVRKNGAIRARARSKKR